MQLLQADPRSVYRKSKCGGQPYHVALDGLDATCRFREDGQGVVVQSVARVASAAEHRGTEDVLADPPDAGEVTERH